MIRGYDFDDVMLVPKRGILSTRANASTACEIVKGLSRIKPIISANMPSVTGSDMATAMWHVGAYGVLHRFNSVEENINDYKTVRKNSADCACSLGLNEGLGRFLKLFGEGCKVFVVDVAHGHHDDVFEFTRTLRDLYGTHFKLVVGNVATEVAATELSASGVNAVKVGIGPGAACTTRKVTGFGVPQLTAIMNVSNALRGTDVKIIADGGIKTSGDIVKSLAAGADSVMIGSLLAGADESPSPGSYYGNASYRVKTYRSPEGTEFEVPLTGPVEDTVKALTWGIKSGISYSGGRTLGDLQANAEWIEVNSG